MERLTGDRSVMIPWVVFTAAAMLTGFGALGPAAVAILAPIALRFAEQHNISPLMMGLMAIHGAQAGAFSPTSVYGGITNTVVAAAGIAPDPLFLFFASFAFNAVLAAAIFLVLGGMKLRREQHRAEELVDRDEAEPGLSRERLLTLLLLGAMAIATLAFRIDIGMASMAAAALLALAAPISQKHAVDRVAWSTVLLICGVVTYVGLMQRMGTVTAAGETIAMVGMPPRPPCWESSCRSQSPSSNAATLRPWGRSRRSRSQRRSWTPPPSRPMVRWSSPMRERSSGRNCSSNCSPTACSSFWPGRCSPGRCSSFPAERMLPEEVQAVGVGTGASTTLPPTSLARPAHSQRQLASGC
jgi:hypothetical protein